MLFDHQAAEFEVDPLLGQPRMVPDPRITTAQAATILGLTPARVRYLVERGELPVHGSPHSQRRLLMSQVRRLAELGEPITLRQAAKILGCSTDDVRTLVAAGQLTHRARSNRPLYRPQVEDLARRRSVEPVVPRPRRRARPAGCVSTSEAAWILGVSRATVRRQAMEGLLPSTRDDRGHYWFRPDQLEMVVRARRDSERAELSVVPAAPASAP